MAQAASHPEPYDAWLSGVDFPRMKIENTREFIGRVDVVQISPRRPIRKQSKITPASAREILPQ
ncbi:MAG: hypothetical protein QOK03_2361 [Candidatus Binataceae bacterium]|jgi:hypothetical protein|nr:hypothetical protein [Candidatus Binataceae bacterium]